MYIKHFNINIYEKTNKTETNLFRYIFIKRAKIARVTMHEKNFIWYGYDIRLINVFLYASISESLRCKSYKLQITFIFFSFFISAYACPNNCSNSRANISVLYQ